MNVAYLVLKDSRPYSLFKASEMFYLANKIASTQLSHIQPFNVRMIGFEKTNIAVSEGVVVTTSGHINDNCVYDLIIIPSIALTSGPEIIKKYGILSAWLLDQYEQGAVLCSLCTGAFLIANTGLLDGHNGTTHWGLSADFQKMFPKIAYLQNKVFSVTPSKRIFTSGGSDYASFLILYFIRGKFGNNIASFIAKAFGIDMSRTNQQFFHNLEENVEAYSGSRIAEAIRFIEQQYKTDISMDDIASSVSLSNRHFSRIFKSETGMTPSSFVKKIRIREARKLLEESNCSVKEIMYQVGYSDPKSFRKAFFELTNLSPTQYRAAVSLAALEELV